MIYFKKRGWDMEKGYGNRAYNAPEHVKDMAERARQAGPKPAPEAQEKAVEDDRSANLD